MLEADHGELHDTHKEHLDELQAWEAERKDTLLARILRRRYDWLLSAGFGVWSGGVWRHRDMQRKDARAIASWMRASTRSHFRTWSGTAKREGAHRRKLCAAVAKVKRRNLQGRLRQWAANVKFVVGSRQLIYRLLRRMYLDRLRRSMGMWRAHTMAMEQVVGAEKSRAAMRGHLVSFRLTRMVSIVQGYLNRKLRAVLSEWHTATDLFHRQELIVRRAVSRINNRCLVRCFARWGGNAARRAEESKLMWRILSRLATKSLSMAFRAIDRHREGEKENEALVSTQGKQLWRILQVRRKRGTGKNRTDRLDCCTAVYCSRYRLLYYLIAVRKLSYTEGFVNTRACNIHLHDRQSDTCTYANHYISNSNNPPPQIIRNKMVASAWRRWHSTAKEHKRLEHIQQKAAVRFLGRTLAMGFNGWRAGVRFRMGARKLISKVLKRLVHSATVKYV